MMILSKYKRNFDILIDYLGLSDKFDLRGSRVSLQKNGKVAGHDSSSYDSYILGENVYQLGAMRFKLRLVFFEDRHWIMVAVVKAEFVPKNHYFDPYDWNGAYGFAVGRRTHFMIDESLKISGLRKACGNRVIRLSLSWIVILTSYHFICPLVSKNTSYT